MSQIPTLKSAAPTVRTQAPVVAAAPSTTARHIRTCWVCLKSQDGKLLARYDKARGLLEIRSRAQVHTFDLVALTQTEMQVTENSITADFTTE